MGKGIIFAADILEREYLFNVLSSIRDFIEYTKISNLLLYEYGWKIIDEIHSCTKKPILLDLKMMEFPYMVHLILKRALDFNLQSIMISGYIGEEGIVSCFATAAEKKKDLEVFLFTEFTNANEMITKTLANKCIKLAQDLRCFGVQVPGTKLSRIREVRDNIGDSLKIISCGVGFQRNSKNQITCIGDAIKAGADYEIVGRGIFQPDSLYAPDPTSAAKKAYEIINSSKHLTP